MNMALLILAGGLMLLLLGAELLIRGASRLAARFGMSPLMIGLTIVALGTSAPEIGISVIAAFKGQGDLALGNVVGSNIFNVLVILGISALVSPLVVDRQLIRLEIPVVIGVSALVWWMASDGHLERWEGVILLGGLAGYMVAAIRAARRGGNGPEPHGLHTDPSAPADAAPTARAGGLMTDLPLILAGVVALMFGSQYLVQGASALAREFGLSELIIGLTIVAGGTSVPEVATSVLAVIRGERDLAVGNAIGSCLFNLLAVLGIASVVSPEAIGVPGAALAVDIPIMVATALVCLPLAFTQSRIDRWEGALLATYYVIYTVWLVLDAGGRESADVLETIVLRWVIPLTVMALIASLVASLRARRNPPAA